MKMRVLPTRQSFLKTKICDKKIVEIKVNGALWFGVHFFLKNFFLFLGLRYKQKYDTILAIFYKMSIIMLLLLLLRFFLKFIH